jgi:UDP-N-acetylglucosamine 1-carboxyvinyltransferase
VDARAERLIGAHIYMDVVSVGATINIIMAAVMAEGNTTIENAAKEPHVVDLANFLNSMGARIKGAGTDVIRIKGVSSLHGTNYSIIPDQIEAGTFMFAAAATKGDVTIKNVIPKHLEPMSAKLLEIGCQIEESDDMLRVVATRRLGRTNVKTLPYPGFPTEFPKKMLELVKEAHAVCPNITEACLLLGKEFKSEGEYDEQYIYELVDGFAALGIEKIVITGVKYGDGRHGAVAYDAQVGEYRYLFGENMNCYFHGTGDIFSSVLCGALTKGENVYDATQKAVDFTIACIKQTLPDRENHPYGVKFEECLHLLCK